LSRFPPPPMMCSATWRTSATLEARLARKTRSTACKAACRTDASSKEGTGGGLDYARGRYAIDTIVGADRGGLVSPRRVFYPMPSRELRRIIAHSRALPGLSALRRAQDRRSAKPGTTLSRGTIPGLASLIPGFTMEPAL